MATGITPLAPAQTATQEAHAAAEGYIKRNLVAFDQLLNVAQGGLDDETMSSRWARWAAMRPTSALQDAQHDFGVFGSHFLDLFQSDHGAKAVAGDTARADDVLAVEKASGIIDQGEPK